MAHDETGARVPVQESVVVFGGTKRFGLFVPGHGFTQQFVGIVAGAGMTLMQLRLGPSLADDTGIVGPRVAIMKPGQDFLGL
jgi:hypothetical protein